MKQLDKIGYQPYAFIQPLQYWDKPEIEGVNVFDKDDVNGEQLNTGQPSKHYVPEQGAKKQALRNHSLVAINLLEALLYNSYHGSAPGKGNDPDEGKPLHFLHMPIKGLLVHSNEFDLVKAETMQSLRDRSDNISTYMPSQQNAFFYAMALPYILDMVENESLLELCNEEGDKNCFKKRYIHTPGEGTIEKNEDKEFIESINVQIDKSIDKYDIYQTHNYVEEI